MRLALPAIFALCTTAAFGQILIDPGRLPSVIKNFEPEKNERALNCNVDLIPPQLNFSLRFVAGYLVRVPANQFLGSGHRLRSVLRVVPENNPQPVFLASFSRLPNIPRTARKLELAGLYHVGEGRYAVDWMVGGESGRI